MTLRPTLALGLTLALVAACSRQPETAAAPPQPAAQPAAPVAPPAPAAPAGRTLGLEGLGDLRIGQAPPAAGSWAERGAQIDEGCRTLSSPDYPGVYAMVVGGVVRRITVGQRSDVKLVEGLGVGASEAAVRAAFPGFRDEPHKYEDAPAKYLTAPGVERGGPGLRFEIGQDGAVKLIHVGLMPELAYVAGCA